MDNFEGLDKIFNWFAVTLNKSRITITETVGQVCKRRKGHIINEVITR